MQIFKKIDRKKTKLFSIENLINCFCATLYIKEETWKWTEISDFRLRRHFCSFSLTQITQSINLWQRKRTLDIRKKKKINWQYSKIVFNVVVFPLWLNTGLNYNFSESHLIWKRTCCTASLTASRTFDLDSDEKAAILFFGAIINGLKKLARGWTINCVNSV